MPLGVQLPPPLPTEGMNMPILCGDECEVTSFGAPIILCESEEQAALYRAALAAMDMPVRIYLAQDEDGFEVRK